VAAIGEKRKKKKKKIYNVRILKFRRFELSWHLMGTSLTCMDKRMRFKSLYNVRDKNPKF
jgi:hypothetical protein